MSIATFSRSEALRFGWETLKRNLGLAIGIGVAGLVATVALDGLAGAAGPHAPLTVAFAVMGRLVQVFVSYVWIRLAILAYDRRDDLGGFTVGPPVRLREVKPHWLELLDYLAVWLLLGLLVFGGLILFVVPGVYFAVRYGLAGYLVADRRTDVMGAFRESSELTQGERWNLFVLGLVLVGLNLVGAILLGIGLFFTIPMTAFTGVYAYRRLVERAAFARSIAAPPEAVPA